MISSERGMSTLWLLALRSLGGSELGYQSTRLVPSRSQENRSAGGLSRSSVQVAQHDPLAEARRPPGVDQGAQILQVTGSVLADTTQASGQEYYKLEVMA